MEKTPAGLCCIGFILGAGRRFIGVLIEHYAELFRLAFATQCVLLTVTDKHITYAETVYDKLIESGISLREIF